MASNCRADCLDERTCAEMKRAGYDDAVCHEILRRLKPGTDDRDSTLPEKTVERGRQGNGFGNRQRPVPARMVP